MANVVLINKFFLRGSPTGESIILIACTEEYISILSEVDYEKDPHIELHLEEVTYGSSKKINCMALFK
ncbi:hypothetical protein ERL59_13685 [Chengkuizengella sp. YPA3-1-1]|uniref:Uncharacterized protein n=1 Tax=Chengkuizengella marina TaxID=2507566 RepID=A0A6N9Q584_9BACL|nr:hypothetical protein [Chengkuizengella marina]